VARINVERRIAADPTSAVLLLAAPIAAELWPGATVQAAEPGDRIRLLIELPAAPGLAESDEPVVALVQADPPLRTPTAYVIHFSFTAAELPATVGELTLAYASTEDDDVSATVAQLVLTVPDGAGVPAGFVRLIDDSARRFLDNLAAAAEHRSRAA
jgi:hypothetical protein